VNHKEETLPVTIADFRRMALSFPETEEGAHMGHPDFRVGGKIFATIPDSKKQRGMVKLTPDQQQDFVGDAPDMFEPVQGGWGRGGATYVNLRAAKKPQLHSALTAAWLNRAPKALAKKFEATL
jgi:hypothetical protein